jgi:hypothetical protein
MWGVKLVVTAAAAMPHLKSFRIRTYKKGWGLGVNCQLEMCLQLLAYSLENRF